MTELLIVIAIIVLFITLALPAFNLINGGRSIAAGTNGVAAMLGRARAEAIGIQQVRGVGFFVDAASGRSTMCIVHQPFLETPSSVVPYVSSATPALGTYAIDTSTPAATYWVYGQPINGVAEWAQTDQYATDIEPETDNLPLPTGVGAQLLNNYTIKSSNPPATRRQTNGYVSFGAIFFDGTGSLVSRQMSFAQYGLIGTAANLPAILPAGQNLPASGVVVSQFGVVLFDIPNFLAAGGDMVKGSAANTAVIQSVFTTSPGTYTSSGEQSVEFNFTDKNATPLLINRYNGTLIKSE